MAFDPYFFRQFKEDIKEEATNPDINAHQETKDISFTKCNHKNIKFVNGELRCSCGVAYSGPNLDALYKALTS